jgi:hypothetical protein
MATIAAPLPDGERRPDLLSGTPRAGFIDRWIYVFMAAWFIAIVLTGFIPDSITKVAAVQSGARPPFPLPLHLHAVLMGSFLLLLLAQTSLVATGRGALHRRLGLVAMVLVPAMVIVGVILIPTMYYQTWDAAQKASGAALAQLQQRLLVRDNVMLLQIRNGLLFPLFIFIGLRARQVDGGLHKRMMILATAGPLEASFARMEWIPNTFPASPLAMDVYVLVLAVLPMFAWDVVRNRSVHRAYSVWLPIYVAASLVVNLAWDRPWWHTAARHIMGV